MRKLSKITKILLCILSVLIIVSVSFYFASTSKKTQEKLSNNETSMIDNVDVVYYINLDNRPDRNEEFLSEMKKMNFPEDKIVRISAVYEKERGHLGCTLSHIKTLQMFIETDYNNCIVFEDDFEFSKSPEEVNKAFRELFDNEIDFDVCMISGNEYDLRPIEKYPFIEKVHMCLTTSGYMLSKKFAPVLLENFKEGAIKLEESYERKKKEGKKDPNDYAYDGQYAIDQHWVSLQEPNNWYIFNPKLGKQRNSYSDIMGGNVKYNV
jgi:GR25 family glycosyltransferase involved in LPS biosynthesis